MKQSKEERTISKKSYYLKNREQCIEESKERVKILRARNYEFIREYKRTHACVDCGFSDPRALDFDHVKGDKIKEISRLVYSSSLKRLQTEIDKCEMRCSNCHRIKTCERRDELNEK